MNKSKVAIRPVTEDDIDAIYALSSAVHLTPLYKTLIPATGYERFLQHYTPSYERHLAYHRKISERLRDPRWFIWVAEQESTVCGYTMAYDADEALELRSLFVDDAYQGQGIGRRLFETSCSVARSGQPIVLDVIAANKRAIGLYERSGFHRIEQMPKPFYGAPMIRMQKH